MSLKTVYLIDARGNVARVNAEAEQTWLANGWQPCPADKQPKPARPATPAKPDGKPGKHDGAADD